ncbi:unnamed protein product [Gulo gulo]|uniref:Uncharacterized protein n=1 Tax=Gulo gulo TaxID=48420 RepID=A0A9X9Q9X1_GULGU|nr:unnamed protein product [Gulo gulo]
MRGPLCGHLHKTCVCSSIFPIGSLPSLPPHQLHSTPGPYNPYTLSYPPPWAEECLVGSVLGRGDSSAGPGKPHLDIN